MQTRSRPDSALTKRDTSLGVGQRVPGLGRCRLGAAKEMEQQQSGGDGEKPDRLAVASYGGGGVALLLGCACGRVLLVLSFSSISSLFFFFLLPSGSLLSTPSSLGRALLAGTVGC
jgi:hypothetical protein